MARASAVYLEGPSLTAYSHGLGMYFRTEDYNQNRYVYSNADGSNALWFAGDSWYVGSKESTGQQKGFITATENTDVPEDVAAPWRVTTPAGGWTDAPIKCVTDQVHAQRVEDAKSGAADTFFLAGSTPADANAVCLGKYVRQAKLLNDRYIYLRGPLLMWWSAGRWYVGEPEDVGSMVGYMNVDDDAFLPELINSKSSVWRVAGDDGFVEAPEVACTLQQPTDQSPSGDSSSRTDLVKALQPFQMAVCAEVMVHDGPSKAGQPATEGALQKAFAAFDTDGNGTLSAEEVLQLLTRKTAAGGSGLGMEDAEELVKLFDKNGDGVLDMKEFMAAVSQVEGLGRA